ncbi:hypothetical protein ACFFGV_17175 [Pontibacillus salicampi]|uniref:SMI1/KNR4 family protein n=1 Tax=Pontibacillus salicampi TaxID=1449801 RepID=A0ABV6LSM7_9BACI
MQEIDSINELNAVVKGFHQFYKDKANQQMLICHPIDKIIFLPMNLDFLPQDSVDQAYVADTLICSSDGITWNIDFASMFKKDYFFIADLSLKTYLQVEYYMYDDLLQFLNTPIKGLGILPGFKWKNGELGELEYLTFEEFISSDEYLLFEPESPEVEEHVEENKTFDHEDLILFLQDNPKETIDLEDTLSYLNGQLIKDHVSFNQFQPATVRSGTGISTLLSRFNLHIDERSVIAYYSTDYSDWIFTYTGLFVRYAERVYRYYYKDLKKVYNTGLVKQSILLNFHNKPEIEITLHPSSQDGCERALVTIIKEGHRIWDTFLKSLPKPNFIEDFFTYDIETAESYILYILNQLEVKPQLIKLAYQSPEATYKKYWNEATANGYPDEETLNDLNAIKKDLQLNKTVLDEIEKPTLLHYYRNNLEQLNQLDLPMDELKEEVFKLKEKYQLQNEEAHGIEENVLGTIVSINSYQTAYVATILEEFDTLGNQPFGDRFYGKHDIPEKKWINAQNTYLHHMSINETVLFLYDDTLMGSAKEGFVILHTHIYTRNSDPIPLNLIQNIELKGYSIILHATDGSYTLTVTQLRNTENFIDFMEIILPNITNVESNSLIKRENNNNNRSVDEEITTEELKEFWEMKLQEFQKEAIKLDDKRIGMGEAIDTKKAKNFLKVFNKKNKMEISANQLIGYYDNTVFGKGDEGFAIVKEGICSTMKGNVGYFAFDQMVDLPDYHSKLNSKIFIYATSGKKELYCTGTKGPKILYDVMELLYGLNEEFPAS